MFWVKNRLLKGTVGKVVCQKKHTVIPTIGGKKCRNDGTFDRKLSVAIPTTGGPCRTGEMSESQHVTDHMVHSVKLPFMSHTPDKVWSARSSRIEVQQRVETLFEWGLCYSLSCVQPMCGDVLFRKTQLRTHVTTYTQQLGYTQQSGSSTHAVAKKRSRTRANTVESAGSW